MPEPKVEPTEEAPKPLTLDDVNKAYTAREKRTMEAFGKLLDERIAALKPAEQAKPAADQATKPAEGDIAATLRKEFEGKLAERDRELKLRDEKLAAEKETRLRSEEDAETRAALAGANIRDAAAVKGALALLKSDKRIGRDDEGRVCFLEPKDGYIEKKPVAEGIKGWAASDEGKLYLPPTAAAGSGARPARGPAGSGKGNDKLQRVEAAKGALMSAITGGRAQ